MISENTLAEKEKKSRDLYFRIAIVELLAIGV